MKFKKDGMIMGVRDDVQASAFIKNGWKKVEEPLAAEVQETETVEVQETEVAEAVEETKQGGKSTRGPKK